LGIIDVLLFERERSIVMRYSAILGSVIALAALPAAGQTNPSPLAYIVPLPPASVQNVQAKLRQAGVYNGRIDGMWGNDSEAALERFQQQHQLQVTGQLNEATAATLGLNPTSLIAATEQSPAPPPADHLLPASVRAVQARLGALGFYSGPVDGVWGQGTEVGIKALQRARGLPPDGQLGPATTTAMGLGPDVLAYR
jgi:peptidoglycan hydrolase-like protein with peptidoglycan-binding domain